MSQLQLIECGQSEYGDDLDFYETPEWAADAIVDVLLENEDLRRFALLDPAAGRGALISPFMQLQPCCLAAVELNEKRYTECEERWRYIGRTAHGDFLTMDLAARWPGLFNGPLLTAMNPPYTEPRPTIGLEFVERAIEITKPTNGIVAALLPLDFATGVERCERIHDKHPCSVYPLRRRPHFGGEGSGSRPFAWFVWDFAHPERREWRVIG